MRLKQNTRGWEGGRWSEEGERESQMGQQSASFPVFLSKHKILAFWPTHPFSGRI